MSRIARLQRHIEYREDLTYWEGLIKQKAKIDDIVQGMDSTCGEVILNALENLERSATEAALKSRTKRSFYQARAEVKTARYILGILKTYRTEQKNLAHALKEMEENNG